MRKIEAVSERNKKTPWDEELEAQVLAEEQARRKQANAEQLESYDVLSVAQEPKPTGTLHGEDSSDLAALIGETESSMLEPEKPALGIDIEKSTFTDEDSAVTHFERAFATSGEPDNLWTKLEGHFGKRELRLYIGTAVLILVALFFSLWFGSLANRGVKARKAATQVNSDNEAAIQEVTGSTENPE